MDYGGNRKVPFEDSEDGCFEAKRLKGDDKFELLSFSDCILLHIFTFCDANTLYSLSRVCKRLRYLVEDDHLWVHVDARGRPNTADKVNYCEKRLNGRTRSFYTTSINNRSEKLLTYNFYDRTGSFDKLTVLALENQTIDGTFRLWLYPQTLQEISFRKSYITEHRNFFMNAHHTLKDLRVLIMDQCQWLEPENLSLFAHLPSLEILSLYMCKKLADDRISDISDFKKLKILNARFTGLGNKLISFISQLDSLQELYLQCYAMTYRLDRFKRKLAISRGEEMTENAYLSDDDENIEMNPTEFCKKYGRGGYYRYYMDNLSEVALYYFNNLHSSMTSAEPPKKSVLYRPQYDGCACGWSERKITYDSTYCVDKKVKVGPSHKNEAFVPSSSPEEDESLQIKTLKTKLSHEQKILRFKLDNFCVPYVLAIQIPTERPSKSEVYEATPENKNRQWLSFREPLNDYEITMLEHTHNSQYPGKNLLESVQYFCVQRNGDAVSFKPPPLKNFYHYDPDDSTKTEEVEEVFDENLKNKSEGHYMHITSEQSTSCIKRLSLRGYPYVTDARLAYLSQLDLEVLDLTYTSVTETGVRNYLKSHPECRVIHETACVCPPAMHF